jgi:hypothetical protein
MGFNGTQSFPTVIVDAGTSGSIWRGRAIVGTGAGTLLLSASAARMHASIYNHTNCSIFVGYDHPGVSSSSFDVKLTSGSYFELPRPIWRGSVYGVADAANAQAFMLDVSGSVST